MNRPELIKWDEAGELLNAVKDVATKAILKRASVIARLRFYDSTCQRTSDFDMLFFMEVLCELFRDPEVIRKELDGLRPGAWSEDPSEYGD